MDKRRLTDMIMKFTGKDRLIYLDIIKNFEKVIPFFSADVKKIKA